MPMHERRAPTAGAFSEVEDQITTSLRTAHRVRGVRTHPVTERHRAGTKNETACRGLSEPSDGEIGLDVYDRH